MRNWIPHSIVLALAVHAATCLAAESIVVRLSEIGRVRTISVNGVKKEPGETAAWFAELRKQFGENVPIDIQCEEGVTLLAAVQFLKVIEAASWKNLTVRSVPEKPLDWRFWTAVPEENRSVTLIVDPSPK